MSLRVVEAGPWATVQDLGRPGYATFGVPPSGAMDALALRAANALVGNDEGAAVIEIALVGVTLAFDEDAIAALTGAAFDGDLDGAPVPNRQAFRAGAGRTLRLGRSGGGARAYLAIRGGIGVPPVLGSRSTLVSAGIGGYAGRALAAGDVLPIGAANGAVPLRRLAEGALPVPGPDQPVRVIPGPQAESFTDRGMETFFHSFYEVSPRSNRVGVRLEGPALEHAGAADVDPEGVVTGAVQVPGDGRPIVLGPDRPVTGGYAKIATVITADLSLIAQARPGDTLRFVEVSVEEARHAWRERERALAEGVEEP